MEEKEKPTKGELAVVWFCATAIVTMLVLIIFTSNVAPNFLMTDSYCDVKINESFINGTMIGMEYTIASITQEVIECKTIPISYGGYNYTLVALECLDLNLTQGGK